MSHKALKAMKLDHIALKLMTRCWVLTWKPVDEPEVMEVSQDGGKTWSQVRSPSTSSSDHGWTVEARLVVRCFQEFQKEAMDTFSAISTRTG